MIPAACNRWRQTSGVRSSAAFSVSALRESDICRWITEANDAHDVRSMLRHARGATYEFIFLKFQLVSNILVEWIEHMFLYVYVYVDLILQITATGRPNYFAVILYMSTITNLLWILSNYCMLLAIYAPINDVSRIFLNRRPALLVHDIE